MNNIFENNEQPAIIHGPMGDGSKLYSVLPALPDGQHYELRKLVDGRVAIAVVG